MDLHVIGARHLKQSHPTTRKRAKNSRKVVEKGIHKNVSVQMLKQRKERGVQSFFESLSVTKERETERAHDARWPDM